MYLSRSKSRAAAVLLILFLLVGQLGLSPTPALAAESAANSDIIPGAFKDVPQTNPNFLFINYLSKLGLLKGFPDGTFMPAAGLTRAEAAAVLVKAAGLKTEPAKSVFKDVSPNHWAAASIAAAKDAGLLAGYPDGTFRPEARLTRAEGITLILKLSRQADSGVELPVLADLNSKHWAARPVAVGLASEMIGLASDNSHFLPDAVLTRGSLSRALAVLLTKDPTLYNTSLTNQLKVVSGSVTVIRAGSETAETITGSTELKPGDMVNTGTSGAADINFPDGTGLRLEQGSSLTIKEAIGRSYIKADGTPGTAVESLTVDLKSGKLFGALATSAETSDENTTAQAQAMSLGSLTEDRVRTAAAETKPLPWWKQSGVKRTKVKIDMPTGVAAIRGTFWQNTVNPDGSFDTTLLTGSAEITAAGQTVDLAAGQRTKVAGTGAPPAPPAPLTIEDKKEWVKQKDWAQTTAQQIAAQQPVAVPPPPPAEKPEQPVLTPTTQLPQQPNTTVTDIAGSPADIINVIEGALTSAEGSIPTQSSSTGSNESGNPTFVTGVQLDTHYVSLVANGPTYTVTAHVYPTDATNPALTWTSSNPSVASVANGVVTPLSEGYAVITVTTVDGSFTDECSVTVTAPGSGGGGSTPASGITFHIKNIDFANLDSGGVHQNTWNSGADTPSISGDGRYVTFVSGGNLILNYPANNKYDTFVRDRLNGTTSQANITYTGQPGAGAQESSISSNGRFVVFWSSDSSLVSVGNSLNNIYVRDLQEGQTSLVSVTTTGTAASGGFFGAMWPSISADGRYVAFQFDGSNLVPNDTNGYQDIFVRDRDADNDGIFDEPDPGATDTIIASVYKDDSGQTIQADRDCWNPTISPDGRFVTFTTSATIFGHTEYGLYIRDLTSDGLPAFIPDGYNPVFSADGRYVAYELLGHIYLWDRDSDNDGVYDVTQNASDIVQIDVSNNGASANTGAGYPSMSADGRYIAFVSDATNLNDFENNLYDDIFVRDTVANATKKVSVTQFGEPADGNSGEPAISADGKYVAFSSGAENLIDGDFNGEGDIFVVSLDVNVPVDTVTPSAPTGLSAADSGPNWAVLAWNPATDNGYVTRYSVFRSTSISGPFTEVGSVYGNVYSYWDTSLTPLTSYYYYLRAEDEDGNTSTVPQPVRIDTIAEPAFALAEMPVAAGYDYSLARLGDGSTWAWGEDYYGSLGIGTSGRTITPQPVVYNEVYFTDVAAMDAYYHTLAVRSDGTVWAWGSNDEGQLGLSPDYGNHPTPVQVAGLTNIRAVAAGEYHNLALGSDGTVWSWGGNYKGQLGNRFDADRGAAPMRVVSPDGDGYLTDVIAIAAGYSTSVALKSDGSVWTWGYNYWGDLGTGGSPYDNTPHPIPVQVSGLTDIVAVSGGYDHFAALKSDGTVWTWGSNSSGELGDGTTTLRTSPVQVLDPGDISGYLTGVTAIAAGWNHTLALKNDGSVWGWGNNSYYQLGDGTWSSRKQPVQVLGPGGTGNLSGITAIAADYDHSLAFKNDGTVWAWGYNYSGQLGDGTRTDRSSPVQVILPI